MGPQCPQHRANHLPCWAVAHPLGHFGLSGESRGSWSHLLQASTSEPSLPWPGPPVLFSATFQNYLSAPFLKPHNTLTPQAAGAGQQWQWWACPPPLQEQAGAGGCVHRAPGGREAGMCLLALRRWLLRGRGSPLRAESPRQSMLTRWTRGHGHCRQEAELQVGPGPSVVRAEGVPGHVQGAFTPPTHGCPESGG